MSTYITIIIPNYILNNIDNYKSEIDSNEHILFIKYIGLIHELIQCYMENIVIQNEEYLKHILKLEIIYEDSTGDAFSEGSIDNIKYLQILDLYVNLRTIGSKISSSTTCPKI